MNGSLTLCPDFQLANSSMKTLANPWLEQFGVEFSKVHGPLSLAVCAFGIASNIANIVVLTRPLMRHSATNQLLQCLAVADLMTMVIYMPVLCHFYISRPTSMKSRIYSPNKSWVIYQTGAVSAVIVFHSIAIWITVLLAVFRYVHIGFPSIGPRFATKQRALVCVAITTVCCFLLVIPNALINHVDSCLGPEDTISDQSIYYFVNYISNSGASDSCWKSFNSQCMIAFNFWLNASLYKIVPCCLLAMLTVLLIYELRLATKRRRKLHRSKVGLNVSLETQLIIKNNKRHEDRGQQNAENRTTMLLLIILICFLIVEMPQGILVICLHLIQNFYENVYRHLGDFIDFTTLVNESINFVIYTSMSQQFRSTFCDVFYITRIKAWISKRSRKSVPNSSTLSRGTQSGSTKCADGEHNELDSIPPEMVPRCSVVTSFVPTTSC